MGFQIARHVTAWAFIGLTTFIARASSADAPDNAFHVSVGPGFYQEPLYPGSRRERNIYFPFLDAELDNRWYTSANDLVGIYAVKTAATQAGAALEYDLMERLSRDDARLRGLPDVKQTPRAKLFASQTVFIFTGDVNLATDVSGRGEGTVGQANLWLTIPVDPTFSINLGPGMTWADSRYMHDYFSVTPAEAAVGSGASYVARAGVLDAHLNGLAEWLIAKHYRLGVQLYLSRLQRNAEASPLVIHSEQRTLAAWLAYRFQ